MIILAYIAGGASIIAIYFLICSLMSWLNRQSYRNYDHPMNYAAMAFVAALAIYFGAK